MMTLAEAITKRAAIEAELGALVAAGNAPQQGQVPASASQPLGFAANANDAWRLEGRLIRLDDMIDAMRAAEGRRSKGR